MLPIAPLRQPLFRNLAIANLVSNLGSFMDTAGAAWVMVEMTSSLYTALVYASVSVPIFLAASLITSALILPERLVPRLQAQLPEFLNLLGCSL